MISNNFLVTSILSFIANPKLLSIEWILILTNLTSIYTGKHIISHQLFSQSSTNSQNFLSLLSKDLWCTLPRELSTLLTLPSSFSCTSWKSWVFLVTKSEKWKWCLLQSQQRTPECPPILDWSASLQWLTSSVHLLWEILSSFAPLLMVAFVVVNLLCSLHYCIIQYSSFLVVPPCVPDWLGNQRLCLEVPTFPHVHTPLASILQHFKFARLGSIS